MSIRMTKKGNAKLNGVKYKAVPSLTCKGCVFFDDPTIDCWNIHCTGDSRVSKEYTHREVEVIFVKKEKSNATNP